MLVALLMVGCRKEQAPAESSSAAAAADNAPAVASAGQATVELDEASRGDPAPAYMPVSTKDLVGTFVVGGVETRTLELKPGGRYTLKGGVVWDLVKSRWSLEAGGTHLRLHHDHQQTEDLLFGVESADVLVLLNADGSPTHMRSTLDRVKK
ncbi:MAG TPA: hypothetical protein DIW85_11585 [Stenotrophomonas sp.]|nr:hypothetical protein [Stenotrophomonas sp.]